MQNIGLLICVLIFFRTVSAQTPFDGGFSVAAVTTQVDGDSYAGYFKSGIKAGFWVSKPLNNAAGLRMEMNYFPKGSKNSVAPKIDDADFYRLTLHYVEMPLLYEYRHRHYLFEAGLAVNYLFADKQEGYAVSGTHFSNQTGFNRFDFTGKAGIGMVLSDKWYLMAGFSYSLWDAARNYIAPSERIYVYQFNNALAVTLYRSFSSGKK